MEAKPLDAGQFKAGMRSLAGAVNIITSAHAGHRYGMTATAVCSATAEPPTVLVCINKLATTHGAVSKARAFCVNVLSREQADLCWRFAKSGNELERFDGVRWHAAPTGSPILDRAVAWVDCTIEAVYEMGDHYFVLGRVVALEADADHDGVGPHPLLFFKGALGGFAHEG